MPKIRDSIGFVSEARLPFFAVHAKKYRPVVMCVSCGKSEAGQAGLKRGHIQRRAALIVVTRFIDNLDAGDLS